MIALERKRQQAILTARVWLEQDLLFMDTETTGLDDASEICEIAIVDHAGRVVLEQLLRPCGPFTDGATRIHGILETDVLQSPRFAEFAPKLTGLLAGRHVCIYNAGYDLRMLEQSAAAWGMRYRCNFIHHDAMQLYAEFYGDLNRGRFTWQPLSAALRQCHIHVPGHLHRARADAEACRRVVVYVAEQEV